eukprot:763229-Hanusia_phi.AAC.1
MQVETLTRTTCWESTKIPSPSPTPSNKFVLGDWLLKECACKMGAEHLEIDRPGRAGAQAEGVFLQHSEGFRIQDQDRDDEYDARVTKEGGEW